MRIDYDVIKKRKSKATFWGYSDLTTILNAIYTMTGKPGVLYQIKNMVCGDSKEEQRKRFLNREDLFSPKFRFVSGKRIEGMMSTLALAIVGKWKDEQNDCCV